MSHQLSFLLFLSAMILLSGCTGGADSLGMEAAPRAAFESWLEIIETSDFARMWDKLSLTGKERFRYAWEDEKENLTKASSEFKEGFIKRYSFSSFDEVLDEDAKSFFVRSMKVNDDGKLPKKYKVLKESTISNFEFLNNGNACILTFKDSSGNLLPLKMKLQKEGEDWTVIRMP